MNLMRRWDLMEGTGEVRQRPLPEHNNPEAARLAVLTFYRSGHCRSEDSASKKKQHIQGAKFCCFHIIPLSPLVGERVSLTGSSAPGLQTQLALWAAAGLGRW